MQIRMFPVPPVCINIQTHRTARLAEPWPSATLRTEAFARQPGDLVRQSRLPLGGLRRAIN
jgi:hypothetical protein